MSIEIDFESLIQSQPGAIRRDGGEYLILCPWHGERNPSCSVNVVKGLFICHACGVTGNAGKMANQLLGFRANISGLNQYAEEAKKASGLPREYIRLQDPHCPIVAREYLRSRKIGTDQISRFRIGCCLYGLYCGRIIVPLTKDGHCVSFVARDYTGRAIKKVLYPRHSPVSEVLFAYDYYQNRQCVVITEGWADALAVERSIIKMKLSDCGVVALNGKIMSVEQIQMLRAFDSALIMLDKDAYVEAVHACDLLSNYIDKIKISKLSAKDPAEADEEEIETCLKNW